MEPVRILHVLGTLNLGGAESRVVDLYRHIDRTKLQFDFLVHSEEKPQSGQTSSEELEKVRKPQFFDEEVRSLGAHIYVLPRFNGGNLLEYKKAIENFFKDHHDYRAVEGHMTSTASLYLPVAAKYGIKTIAHARSAGVDAGLKGKVTRILRSSLPEKAQVLLACSVEAGVSTFGRKAMDKGRVEIVPNAIDVNAYRFNTEYRDNIRSELAIPEGAFVLGHVGRFEDMKNHRFLVSLLSKLEKQSGENAYRLLLVGAGPLEEEVRKQAAEQGVSEHILYAGRCNPERTAQIYQAFDAFVFPSLYEGLPGTVLEAQSAGLPCLIADTITKEVCVSRFVSRLSLDDPERWISAVMNLKERFAADKALTKTREEHSQEAAQALDEAGFDITTQAQRMENWYLSM